MLQSFPSYLAGLILNQLPLVLLLLQLHLQLPNLHLADSDTKINNLTVATTAVTAGSHPFTTRFQTSKSITDNCRCQIRANPSLML